MNWDQIKGDWHQLSRRLKEKWNKLTDADLKSMVAGSARRARRPPPKTLRLQQTPGGSELDKFTTD